jgi:hypothetical protein
MIKFISICLLVTSAALLSAQSPDAQLPDDLNAAYSSLSMSDRTSLKDRVYRIANIEIRSYPGVEVIVGIDLDNDKVFDEFIGLQTDEDYELNASFKAELIFLKSLFIIRPLSDDQQSYVLRLSAGKDLENLVELIPPHYLAGQQFLGYGLRRHTGDYTFEFFVHGE